MNAELLTVAAVLLLGFRPKPKAAASAVEEAPGPLANAPRKFAKVLRKPVVPAPDAPPVVGVGFGTSKPLPVGPVPGPVASVPGSDAEREDDDGLIWDVDPEGVVQQRARGPGAWQCLYYHSDQGNYRRCDWIPAP